MQLIKLLHASTLLCKSQSLDVCQLFFSNYEKSMKMNYISQNEKWRKKSIFVVFFFLYDGFQFSKINFWFTFRKKKLVTQREKKVRCASAGIKVIFVFSLLLFILRIKTMSCVIIIFDPVIETSHSCNTC